MGFGTTVHGTLVSKNAAKFSSPYPDQFTHFCAKICIPSEDWSQGILVLL